MQDRTNLAVDREMYTENEDTVYADEEAFREERIPVRKKDALRTETPHEDWKERYIRLRADFDNHKRHAEAERERLSGMGRAKVLEDVFPLVEHMERAIRAARDSGDSTGILEGIEMVYRELLRVLEKNGVERIVTVGEPFDPEIHEAVAVSPHPDYPADTVVEEVRAGFVKDGNLLRPASVIVAR
jgi:molecular chaperone GrpE